MNQQDLKNMIKVIVEKARVLKDKHTDEKNAPVSYVAIFCQNEGEYKEFTELVKTFGVVHSETPTGFHYVVKPIETIAGKFKIVKIRKPDKMRPERGDADFNVENFAECKKKYLSRLGFKLIERKDDEMIELMETGADVRVYFSNPHVDKRLGVR